MAYERGKTKSIRNKQGRFLAELLERLKKSAAHRDLPLVLHVREGKDTEGDMAASKQCITLLKAAGYESTHKTYRHCFTGSLDEARMWLSEFPNTVFGMNPKVIQRKVHYDTAMVFANLKIKHVLIETDAPWLPISPQDEGVTTPWSTYIVAKWLAALRGVSLGQILEGVAETLRTFYGLPPPTKRVLGLK